MIDWKSQSRRGHSRPTACLYAVLCCVALLLAAGPRAEAVDLPHLEAESSDGNLIRLPEDAGNSAFILIIGYDRSAADSVQRWSQALIRATDGRVAVFAVIDAAAAPRFIHGYLRALFMRSAAFRQPRDRVRFFLTFDRAGWPWLAPTGKKENAAIVVVDTEHRVVTAVRERYDDRRLATILQAVP